MEPSHVWMHPTRAEESVAQLVHMIPANPPSQNHKGMDSTRRAAGAKVREAGNGTDVSVCGALGNLTCDLRNYCFQSLC